MLAVLTGRLYSRREIPSTHLCSGLTRPPEGLSYEEISKTSPEFCFYFSLCGPRVLVAFVCISRTAHKHKHPCPRRNSNPQYIKASSHRPTPYTAWPPGSAIEPTTFRPVTQCLNQPNHKERSQINYSLY